MKETPESLISENVDDLNQKPYLNPILYWILITGGFFTVILGLFSIVSIIIVSTQQNSVNYTDGLIVSILLLIGGVVLLIGTVIINNWSPINPNPSLDDS